MVKVTQRTFAALFVILGVLGWTSLTAAAVIADAKEVRQVEGVDYSAPTDWMQLTPEEMAGVAYFRQENCSSCHSTGEGGSKIGPDLTTGIRRNAAWMIQHFKSPAGVRPGTAMPPIQLNDGQLTALAALLLKLNPENASTLHDAPDFAVQGALVYVANSCSDCHKVNGGGMDVGPALNGLSKRRSRSWVEDHFLDPPKLSPGTIMPAYKFSQKDLNNLTAYLFALPE